jgi:hypothetical protein
MTRAMIALVVLLVLSSSACMASYGEIVETSSVSALILDDVSTTTPDYQTFIAPYLSNEESLRSYLASPPNPSRLPFPKIGYNSAIGMIEGAYLCGGYKDAFTLIDPNRIVGFTFDYLNAQKGITTQVNSTTLSFLHMDFDERYPNSTWASSGCASTVPVPFTYTNNDRREFLFGKVTPAYPKDTMDCVRSPNGEVFSTPQISSPVPTEVPGSCIVAPTPTSPAPINLEAVYINFLWLRNIGTDRSIATSLFTSTLSGWTATSGTGLDGSTGGFFNSNLDPGSCKTTSILAYWLEMARATGLWDISTMSRAVAHEVVNQIWGNQNPDGSIKVVYPAPFTTTSGCSSSRDSGQSDGLTLIAFDPRVPYWFGTL